MKKSILGILLLAGALIIANPAVSAVWYVDAGIGASGDGTTWGTALLTIQEAIDAASVGDEAWVKAGTYTLAATINVDEQVSLYGGFDGTETAREERDWSANVTTIDGNDAVRCLFVTADNVTIDGFVITKGYTDPALSISGAAMLHGVVGGTEIHTAIANCKFLENHSGRHGGAISSDEGDLSITNCLFQGNTAPNRGGAMSLYASGNLVTITDSQLVTNTGGSGGALYVSSSSGLVTIVGTTFDRNSAAGGTNNDGSAIICDAPLTLTGCVFVGNTATRHGTIVTRGDVGKPFTLTNCLFAGNSAVYGGGLDINGTSGFLGSIILTHCTFTGNSASGGGGAIYNLKALDASSVFTVTNSILWGNGTEIGGTGGTPTVSYSDVQGGYSGTGNIDADPLFVGGGDYHLGAGSPCFNAGTDAGVYNDLDGEPRPLLGGFDMGSDEYSGDCWDLDGDTYADAQCGGDDCDDSDPGVNPGAVEGPFGDPTCSDGLDNDCSGLADASDLKCQFCTVPEQCNDGVDCTEDTCNEETQSCTNTPRNDLCDDENTCTDDVCDALEGCQNTCNAEGFEDVCCEDPACAGNPICEKPTWGPSSVAGAHAPKSGALNYLLVLFVPCAAVLVWKGVWRRR